MAAIKVSIDSAVRVADYPVKAEVMGGIGLSFPNSGSSTPIWLSPRRARLLADRLKACADELDGTTHREWTID